MLVSTNNQNEVLCNCCTTNLDINFCPLENCEYPLCESCEKKVFEINKKCPSCRREININLEKIENIDNNSNLNNIFNSNRNENEILNSLKKFFNKVYNILSLFFNFLLLIIFFSIMLIFGRYITTILGVYSNDFWLLKKGDYFIFHFLLYGIIGILFIGLIFCIFSFFFFLEN